jgi:hypothetical protein
LVNVSSSKYLGPLIIIREKERMKRGEQERRKLLQRRISIKIERGLTLGI